MFEYYPLAYQNSAVYCHVYLFFISYLKTGIFGIKRRLHLCICYSYMYMFIENYILLSIY